MSSATDCEPMDSAVRVTAPTQYRNESARSSGNSKRLLDEDTDDRRCSSKRPKTAENDKKHDMVVLYIPSMPAMDTELCIRIHKMDKSCILTQQFKHARRLLKELGSNAADLVSSCSKLFMDRIYTEYLSYSYGESFRRTGAWRKY